MSREVSATAPSGSVIAQDPSAGTAVAPGSGVDLVVSSGSAQTRQIDVPTLSGWGLVVLACLFALNASKRLRRRRK